MLDGLLNRGFSSKCKSLIKATRTRIEVVRRRAEAKQRFLKEDLAKLLAHGLDINAYGRTEEFLAGLNLLSCYDFIEQSCDYIVKHLSSMQKQRECPEECREAVASLMFAAARFSDLPELRDLRDLFQERYTSSLECFVNQKFVEKLSSRPPVTEKRLQLLQDIASEFSINWDSRGFEQRMAAPSTPAQPQANKYGNSTAADKCNLLDGKGNIAKSDKDEVLPKETPAVSNIGHRMLHGREGNDLRREELDLHFCGRQEKSVNGYRQLSNKGESTATSHSDILIYERQEDRVGKNDRLVKKDTSLSKTEKSGSSSNRKWLDSSGIAYTRQDDVRNDIPKRESWKVLSQEKTSISPSYGGIPGRNEDILFREHGELPGKNEDILSARKHGSSQNEVNSLRKVQEEEVDSLKSYQNTPRPPPYVKSKNNTMPPPYVKPKDSKQKTSKRFEHADSYCDGHHINPPLHNRVDEVNGSNWKQRELDNPVHEGQDNGPTKIRSDEKEQHYQDDKIPLPKPRSTRRKHHKSSSSYNDVSHVDNAGAVKRRSSSRRRDNSRKGLKILIDDGHYRKDEEEKMIDKLLLHYSKKPSTSDFGKLRKKSQTRPSHQVALDTGESSHDRDRDGHDVKPQIVPHPTRSVSLPHGQTATSEAKKIFTRANSFQPDGQARHVHPKLPDYDDLAAHFAALKGQ